MTDLIQKKCKPCERGATPLNEHEAKTWLQEVSGWGLNETATEIQRVYEFKNYYETMAFVNAMAWVAHREDHHPDIDIGYKRCRIRYSTHSIGGLSENDFICAAKINALVD